MRAKAEWKMPIRLPRQLVARCGRSAFLLSERSGGTAEACVRLAEYTRAKAGRWGRLEAAWGAVERRETHVGRGGRVNLNYLGGKL